jgi:hypothetical protein
LGIRIPRGIDPAACLQALAELQGCLGTLHWTRTELLDTAQGLLIHTRLRRSAFANLCEGFDTLALYRRLSRLPCACGADELTREVWAALLGAPRRIDFDDLAALQTHLRIRWNIARAAQKTALAFKTNAAERPEAFWREEEDVGFLLRPDACLIDALVAATQPERTGRLYDFSCYRATEYVILLGIAQEARESDPLLYRRLEDTARRDCIKSGRFHDVFLQEYGSVDSPIPPRYYVPGDRVWFRNPDEHSSNASGYEGSWVIYLGRGLFSNFWKRDAPYTLEAKALEVYHWRHGAFEDHDAEIRMDESRVEALVARTRTRPPHRRAVLSRMARYRDPGGVYNGGGCIDASREFPCSLNQIRVPTGAPG